MAPSRAQATLGRFAEQSDQVAGVEANELTPAQCRAVYRVGPALHEGGGLVHAKEGLLSFEADDVRAQQDLLLWRPRESRADRVMREIFRPRR